MQATTATCSAGGIGRSPLSKVLAYARALVRRSSVVLMVRPLQMGVMVLLRAFTA